MEGKQPMDNPPRARVLVVDDESSIRELLSDLLALNDYHCTTADSGPKAIACVASGPYDLVLLDIKMPGMSGMETLRAIKERAPHQPVVMITAVSETETAVEAMKLGALDYILKPFTMDGLLAKVEEALSKGAARREEQARQKRLTSEAGEQRGQTEQRTREIQSLNRLFQTHLRQRQEAEARWRSLATDFDLLHQQVLALKAKVNEGVNKASNHHPEADDEVDSPPKDSGQTSGPAP